MHRLSNRARTFELVLQPYGAVLLAPDGRVSYVNVSGAEICQHVAAGRTPSEITTLMIDIFDVDFVEALEDTVAFIQHFPLAGDLQGRPLRVTGSADRLSAYEADVALTLRCNLRCTYCYASAGVPAVDELTASQWLQAGRALIDLGVRKATVAGGEPLLSGACMPLLELLREHDVCLQLFTNGMLVTDDIASRLHDLRVNFVQVSLDATSPETHNRYRGQSFQGALNGLNRLVAADVPTVIGANIFPDTLDEVDRLAKLARSLGVGLRCNPIEARGRAVNMVDQSVATESVAQCVQNRVREVTREFADVFLEQEFGSARDQRELCCPFSRGSIGVTPSGRVRLCSQSDAYFERTAPWSLDQRRVWEFESLDEHEAFPVIADLPVSCRPTRDVCGACTMFGLCSGCLPAGYTCSRRKDGELCPSQRA